MLFITFPFSAEANPKNIHVLCKLDKQTQIYYDDIFYTTEQSFILKILPIINFYSVEDIQKNKIFSNEQIGGSSLKFLGTFDEMYFLVLDNSGFLFIYTPQGHYYKNDKVFIKVKWR